MLQKKFSQCPFKNGDKMSEETYLAVVPLQHSGLLKGNLNATLHLAREKSTVHSVVSVMCAMLYKKLY
jgi:hypothetical protein